MKPTDPQGQYQYVDARKQAEAQVQAQARAEFWDRLFLAASASKSIRKILFRTGLLLLLGPIVALVLVGIGIDLHWWGPLPQSNEEAVVIMLVWVAGLAFLLFWAKAAFMAWVGRKVGKDWGVTSED